VIIATGLAVFVQEVIAARLDQMVRLARPGKAARHRTEIDPDHPVVNG
jgi:hypothetical protein